MTEVRPLQVGTADPNGAATPIYANVVYLGNGNPVRVTLTSAYLMMFPSHYPIRPFATGAAHQAENDPLIPAGTTLLLLKIEADALVAANAATLIEGE